MVKIRRVTMAEQPILDVSENSSLGKVEIAPGVIEVITGIAASEVEGLFEMRGSFATDVVEKFGKKSHNKGVKVELTEVGIVIDLYVVLNFGVSIPQVAQEIQTNIRQNIRNMTELEISEINVHVVGMHLLLPEDSANL